MFPSNEAETIELYKVVQGRLGWPIINLQTRFPDAVIENGDDRLTVEFEYKARNFKAHGHDAKGCDLIICWRDDWPDSPVPVMALEDCANEEAGIIRQLLKGFVPRSMLKEQQEMIKFLRGEISRLEKEKGILETELEEARATFEWDYDLITLAVGEDRYWEILGELGIKEMERQHGLPEGTIKHNYAWLPTKKKKKTSTKTSMGINKVKLQFFIFGFIPGFVLTIIALLTRGL